MKIVDVNVLIYAVNRAVADHEPVVRWWTAALNGQELIGLPWISISGLLRIVTNPRMTDSSLRIEEATELVDQWLARPNVQIVGERDGHWELFRGLLHATGAGGNRTTDAHLAALAMSRDATLVSCDSGFGAYRHLRWEDPRNES
jgi:toxin-antitoxin system PIN domain toxin